MNNSYTERRYGIPVRTLTVTDWYILNSYKTVLHGLVLAYGPNCVVSLHSAENRSYPCIAVENGAIDNIFIGTPLSGFPADALTDEAHRDGKDTIGIYYARTANEHAIKCVINVIRNEHRDLIGALCVSIDVSVPIHEFMRSYIPVVDNDLASGISEDTTAFETVGDMINHSIEQALAHANTQQNLSVTERNRLVVQQLYNNDIFDVRGAVGIVAKALNVSRYSIYNYIKVASKDAPTPSEE